MDLNHYLFRSEWRLAAAPGDVFDVLEDLRTYPNWWPEVRHVDQLSDEAAVVTCRSTLPYDLVFTTTQRRRDRAAGILEAALVGDLNGWSRWTIRTNGASCVAVFEEEVDVGKRSLRTLAPVARPAFKANHTLMMRHGERGLRTFLAGFAFSPATTPR